MTNRNSYIRLVQNHRPWMTLNCCKLSLLLLCWWHIWQATTAKRMTIDPDCQRENCGALKVLFNDV